MPEETAINEPAPDYGLPFEQFKEAINALISLRDEGKALLYFTRRRTLRLIGESHDFLRAFAPGLAGDEAIERAAEVQGEIRQIISHFLKYEPLDFALSIMEQERFDGPGARKGKTKPKEAEREAYRAFQKPKLELVAKAIATQDVRERLVRLSTSTGACLEDLDYELVLERSDSQRQKKVATPFLRLRVRYSDIRMDQYLGSLFSFGPPDHTTAAASSFEIECDLSDIDLLMKRLSDAKQRLLLGQEPLDGGE